MDFPIARAEELTNYEIGFKTQWFDRSLTVNGAIFHSDIENFQFSFIDFVRRANVTSNIDDVTIDGAELEVKCEVTRALSVFSNVGLAKSEIETFSLFPQHVGNHVPRSADWSVAGGFDFTQDFSDDFALFVRGDLQYASDRYWFYDNLDVQDPKTYWNMNLGIERGAWTATVWGKNLSDTKAYDTYFPSQSTGLAYDVGFRSRPRTYGVQFSVRF
jgi:iron complex outermembrane recepter protein